MSDYEAVAKQLMADMKAAQERHNRREIGDAEYACIMRNLSIAMAHVKSMCLQCAYRCADTLKEE